MGPRKPGDLRPNPVRPPGLARVDSFMPYSWKKQAPDFSAQLCEPAQKSPWLNGASLARGCGTCFKTRVQDNAVLKRARNNFARLDKGSSFGCPETNLEQPCQKGVSCINFLGVRPLTTKPPATFHREAKQGLVGADLSAQDEQKVPPCFHAGCGRQQELLEVLILKDRYLGVHGTIHSCQNRPSLSAINTAQP